MQEFMIFFPKIIARFLESKIKKCLYLANSGARASYSPLSSIPGNKKSPETLKFPGKYNLLVLFKQSEN